MTEEEAVDAGVFDRNLLTEDPEPGAPEEDPEPEAPDDGLAAAVATLAAAKTNPMQLAIENAELRDSLKGAYVLLRAVLTDKVGPNIAYLVPREAWMAPDPNERLQIENTDRGDVVLTMIRKSRAERRASKTTKPR